jgi:hypothetical protein
MALADPPFDTDNDYSRASTSTGDDPGFPIVTAFVIALGELLTAFALIVPGTVFKLVGYLIGLLVALPAIGVHRQLLRRRTALSGVVSTSTSDLVMRFATALGLLLCAGNAVLLALAWSR